MGNPEIENALNTVYQLVPLVNEAERCFKSARNWGVLDMLGGGMIIDLIKHHKLNRASGIMNEINWLLQKLSQELGNLNIPVDYRMQINGILTFADFVFDDFLVDTYVASKIISSLNQVRRLKEQLCTLQSRLENMR